MRSVGSKPPGAWDLASWLGSCLAEEQADLASWLVYLVLGLARLPPGKGWLQKTQELLHERRREPSTPQPASRLAGRPRSWPAD